MKTLSASCDKNGFFHLALPGKLHGGKQTAGGSFPQFAEGDAAALAGYNPPFIPNAEAFAEGSLCVKP
jgi:hypothetical protein